MSCRQPLTAATLRDGLRLGLPHSNSRLWRITTVTRSGGVEVCERQVAKLEAGVGQLTPVGSGIQRGRSLGRQQELSAVLQELDALLPYRSAALELQCCILHLPQGIPHQCRMQH